MLAMLGPVMFELVPLNMDKLNSKADTSFARHKVMGTAPIYEHTGDSEGHFTIRGKVFPEHFGGLGSLEALEGLRVKGNPLHFMRGDGKAMGWVLIDKVTEDHDVINHLGVGREITFSVTLLRAGPPNADGAIADLIGEFLG